MSARQFHLKALYEVHSWIGVFLGLVLYVVLFSGTVALFVQELEPWQQGTPRTVGAASPAALDRAVSEAVREMRAKAEKPHDLSFSVTLPGTFQPAIEIAGRVGKEPRTWHFDPLTGAPVDYREEHAADVLERLHTDLLLPSPYGRYVVGVLGIVFLVTVISGIILHQKILREFFVLRLHRSVRLKWTDLHKSVGTWALPFCLMIGLTGAMLGLSQPLLMGTGLVSYGGDIDAALGAFYDDPPANAGTPAAMVPFSELIGVARTGFAGFRPEYVVVNHYGDAGASLNVMGSDGRLVYYPSVLVEAASGRIIDKTNWRDEGWAKATYAAMTPLHYGNFGGLPLKLLYALLGLGASFSVVSGLRIWLQRDRNGAGVLAPLATGVFYGFPAACLALLLATRLFPRPEMAASGMRAVQLLGVFALCILFSLVKRRGASRFLLAGCGLMLILFPLLTVASHGVQSWTQGPSLSPTPAVDVLAAVGGVLIISFLLRRP